jgi:formylglycine-generating enzyme required for sulfatase activity
MKFRFFFTFLIFIVCLCIHNPTKNPVEFSLNISKTGNGRLNVSFSDTSIDAGSKITLQAFPDNGALFLGWFGSLQSTLDSIDITVNSNLTIEARFQQTPEEPQMVEIPSKNKLSTMGSSNHGAQLEEKFAHQVMFTYTYFIDKYETSQRQFQQLMGNNPSQMMFGDSGCCIGDSFPVYDVSWYEAALFCNARSKAAGLDTIYDFTAVCHDNLECLYVLENLSIHYDRFGFRLPTEAEWEYACRANASSDYYWGADYPDTTGADDYAWFINNSDETTHRIGLKKPNAFGLFDMAGNVAEWVNDWLDGYSDTLIVNPTGPMGSLYKAFEDSFMRPLRGGSYNLGAKYLRSSCRRGPYDSPARLSDKSIGFRCALGVFFPASAPLSNVKQDTSGVVSCNPSDLDKFMQTSFVKCVFIKKTSSSRKLCFIDFSENGKPVHELPDSLPPHFPVISPNGFYVAYSSKGTNGELPPSTATIRRLNGIDNGIRSPSLTPVFVPRWWVDQNFLDTFIVFSGNTIDNRESKWKQSITYRQKIINGNFFGVPETLCDTGSFYGGLSYDGVFLATGYRDAYVLNLQANDLYTYFNSGNNGTSQRPQVCNVSINPGFDHQDQIMFLDFGSSSGTSIIGKPYGLHTIIFTLTSADSIGWYEKPSEYDTWEDIEWSNNSQYAVAIAQAGDKGSIYCIDLKATNKYLKIAEGTGIREPFLWIDPIRLPQAQDPYYNFGKYNIPGQVSGGQIPLYMKLKLFWSRFPELECVALGGSPTYFGIDPAYITTVKTLNLATISSNPFTSYTLTSNYVLSHVSNLKFLIMGLDPYSMPFDNYCNGLPRTLGYQFDNYNNFWKNGLPKKIQDKIASYDSSQWPDYYFTGFLKGKRSDGWGDAVIEAKDYQFGDSAIQDNILIFNNLANILAHQKTHFLVINFPENPLYKQTPWIGRLGPSHETYSQLTAWLRNLEQQNSYFHFYDANMDGDHDYADSEALDCNHLNFRGAKKMSTRIDSLFRIYSKEQ